MTYTVGQEILDGMVVVASVDTDNLILSIVIPADHSWTGEPLTITYSAGTTEQFIANLLESLKQG